MNIEQLNRCARVSIVLAALVVCARGVPARAQADVEPYQEYGKRVKAAQTVSPLSSNQFGENVSLYNGATEFVATDIDIAGNNALPVRIARRYKVESRLKTGYLGGFGVWDVEVPYLQGVVQSSFGWTPTSGGRCSAGTAPQTSSAWYGQEEIWSGTSLHVPGEGDQELLRSSIAKLPTVTDGESYLWTTSGNYRLRCLAQTANGYPGEGFLAVSPNGTKYYFNHGVELLAPALGKPASFNKFVGRKRVLLLATRVEDRFGNAVTYTYSGSKLSSVASTDGRQIALAYGSGDGLITSATAGDGRIWTYQYSNGDLVGVTLPDGSRWTYAVQTGSYSNNPSWGWQPPYEGTEALCIEPDFGYADFKLQIGHPSGAFGVFEFSFVRSYRDGTPPDCAQREPGDDYLMVSNYFDNFQLLRKTISGPGLPQMVWAYQYDGYSPDFATVPGTCQGCQDWKDVTVTDPEAAKTVHRFGVTYGTNEGRLLSERRLDSGGTEKRLVTNTYLPDAEAPTMPFADQYGLSLTASFDTVSNRIRPLITRQTNQDGATFTWQVSRVCGVSANLYCFDEFARPVAVTKSSSVP